LLKRRSVLLSSSNVDDKLEGYKIKSALPFKIFWTLLLLYFQGGFQKFEEELIINDFPQQARWRVTSKEALAQISEYSDAGITVRGTYYPPGKTVPEGDRKLFLAIESTNELSVQKAKVEITRLLKEELLKLQTSGIHHINKGRYKVL
jgi:ATP-dependent RNA helicase DDX46/PRP5